MEWQDKVDGLAVTGLWAFTSFVFQGNKEFSIFLKLGREKDFKKKMVKYVRMMSLPTVFCGISMFK